MTTANPRARVMPPRPPKYCPISINKSVRATSKKVVRKTLIFPSILRVRHSRAKCRPPSLRSNLDLLCHTLLLSRLDTRGGRGLFRRLPLEAHRVFLPVAIHNDVVAGKHRAFENLQRKRILDQALNRPAKRPRAVSRVIALAQEQFFRRRLQLQSDLSLC